MPRFGEGFALLVFDGQNRLAVDEPLAADSRIVSDSAAFVSRRIVASVDRLKGFRLKCSELRPSA
jgi:hypothetical protein